jgi:amino acid transporter
VGLSLVADDFSGCDGENVVTISTRKLSQMLKNLVIGKSRDPRDTAVFHRLSLVAFFAWVGLGADGLSSSNYGPAEAFLALGEHPYLGVFVALGTAITIFIIGASYSQIVELFPTGGGGYFVASKLLSPWLGMVSGCALLIDYVLTISVSIASGADALCSFLPLPVYEYKLHIAVGIVVLLVLLNMRGVKESVVPLAPIFLTFLATHVFVILYAIFVHLPEMGTIAQSVRTDVRDTISSVGLAGLVALILRSYSMGAGTYTGLEAISNGVPILREPRVHTARMAMRYMAVSLAFIVMGLMLGYLIYNVRPEPGKTLNAVFLARATTGWNSEVARLFVLFSLLSEAVLLAVAAQTGFLGGPRVLANMSLDRWFPTRFSLLSDRLVTQNGILIMGGLSLIIMILTGGSVRLLVVLYSINVFITFTLSQLGMVRHGWLSRRRQKAWLWKLSINGVGLVLAAFILVSMVIFKFFEGGWVTLLITGALIVLAILIRRHYDGVAMQLRRLDELVERAEARMEGVAGGEAAHIRTPPVFDSASRTAVVLVNGFNGTGLHTLLSVMRLFGGSYRNFVFLEIGALDVGNFKGPEEVEHLHAQVRRDLDRYVQFVRREGFHGEAVSEIGVDVVDEVERIAPSILQRYPGAVFFGGKLLFASESIFDWLLHNQIVFAVQRRLHRQGVPFVILPLRV